ncbi:MAG: hypothetical protein IJ837_03985 [Clostridia bacterium]|nr:hypothetical protein [Clostridia bacterium]
MKKVMTRFFSLLFAFAFSFFCCGCTFTYNKEDVTPRSDYYVPSPTPSTDSSSSDDDSSDEEESGGYTGSGEFLRNGKGEYVGYSGYWKKFSGIRLSTNPQVYDVPNDVYEDTKSERERFFRNVYEQFDVLSQVIENYMNGVFGLGVDENTFSSGDYHIKTAALNPIVKLDYDQDEEYNKMIGNTTENIMNTYLTGWTYEKKGDVYELTQNKASSDDSKKFKINFSDSEKSTQNKNFVIARLMEIVLKKEEKTTYSFAENETNINDRINGYQKEFNQLGFDYSKIEQAVVDFIKTELIGEDVINYYKSSKSFSEPYIDENNNGQFDEPEPFVEDDLDFIKQTFIEGTYQYFVDVNKNGIKNSNEPLLRDIIREGDSESGIYYYDSSNFEGLFLDGIMCDDNYGIYYINEDDNGEFNEGEEIMLTTKIVSMHYYDVNENSTFDGDDQKLLKDETGNFYYIDNDADGVFTQDTDQKITEHIVNMYYFDANSNKVFDSGDKVLKYDASGQFYYCDKDENGEYTSGEPMFRFAPTIERYFQDLINNTKWDNELYFDINNNKQYDSSFSVSENEPFCFDLDSYINDFSDYLKTYINGEPFDDEDEDGKYKYGEPGDPGESFVDANKNGIYDEGLFKIVSVEVLDIESKTYFHPGIKAVYEKTTNEDDEEEWVLKQKRTLTNMPYDSYTSCVFVANDSIPFSNINIYVDSEEDFLLDIYLKFYVNSENYFITKLCALNLDHTQSCDFIGDYEERLRKSTGEVENGETAWETQRDFCYDSEIKRNAISYLSVGKYFKNLTKDDYILNYNLPEDLEQEFDELGDEKELGIMAILVRAGVIEKLNEEIKYNQRVDENEKTWGYHTSKVNNHEVGYNYSYQTIKKSFTDENKNGEYDEGEQFVDSNGNGIYDEGDELKALCYDNPDETYFEFVFVPHQNESAQNYNFKFLITTPNL